MNKVIAWLKSGRLKQILTVVLAGLLVFVSTACNGALSAKNADQVKKVKTIYPGAETPAKRTDVERALPQINERDFEKSKPGGQIQRDSDLGDRVENRLSTVKKTFDKASEFIKEDAKEALDKHENVSKPGLR
jgi:outer membrane protein assembly factor BamD (BamD/ComL family)